MKTILSLILVFSSLFILDKVFPYQSPCDCEQVQPEQVKQDTYATVDLVDYTSLEEHQVARFENGEPYDFSHDLNVTPIDDPAIPDDIPIRGNKYFEIEPCLDCNYQFVPTDNFEEVRQSVEERVENLNTYRHEPSKYVPKRWNRHAKKVLTRTTP
ncbi:hypothetical protein [Aureispira sp. CCB-QB1]|uniref:hypothetical protein n=1 Tax=Aureispira sp. CCB-QB1 TaxID=1313421 RepID=UPI0006991A7E|nr:hypothetical protein [Aureispira sp. CCB-QB1]